MELPRPQTELMNWKCVMCVCLSVPMWMYKQVWASVGMCVFISAYMYVSVHIYVYKQVWVCMYVCVCYSVTSSYLVPPGLYLVAPYTVGCKGQNSSPPAGMEGGSGEVLGRAGFITLGIRKQDINGWVPLFYRIVPLKKCQSRS